MCIYVYKKRPNFFRVLYRNILSVSFVYLWRYIHCAFSMQKKKKLFNVHAIEHITKQARDNIYVFFF